MIKLNHPQDKVYIIDRIEAHIICQSESDPSKRYVVRLTRSLDDMVSWGQASCQCADWKFRRRDCKHIRSALTLMKRRQQDAIERARQLAQGARVAGWSRARFFGALNAQARLNNDMWSAVRAIELDLQSEGVVEDVV